jgi:hypothetical protein
VTLGDLDANFRTFLIEEFKKIKSIRRFSYAVNVALSKSLNYQVSDKDHHESLALAVVQLYLELAHTASMNR